MVGMHDPGYREPELGFLSFDRVAAGEDCFGLVGGFHGLERRWEREDGRRVQQWARWTGRLKVLALALLGPAILLCGASTAVAFGSLGFASNADLASLGRLSAMGVIIASLTSVLPG